MVATQWLLAFATGSNTGAARFGAVLGNPNGASTFQSSEATTQIPWAAAGKFKRAKIFINVAPSSGKSWRFQLSVNGTPSTAIDLTISDTATDGAVTADVTISAGDLVSWKCTPSGTPTAFTKLELWLEWEPTNTDEFVYGGVFGQGITVSAAAVFNPLLHAFGESLANLQTENLATAASPAPIAGQITALYVRLSAAPTSTHSWDVSIRNNAADIGSLLNISGANTTGNQTGLSHAVSVLDRLCFHVVNRNGTPTNTVIAWSVIFKPTTTGQWCLTGSDATTAAATHYWMPVGGNAGHVSHSTTEANMQVHGPPGGITAQGLCYRINTTPGAGKSWTVSSRLSGADGTLTINTGNTTSGSDVSHSDAIAADQLFNIGVVANGGPTGMSVHCWGMGFGPAAVDVNESMALMQATSRSYDLAGDAGASLAVMQASARSYDLDISAVNAAMAVLQAAAQLDAVLLDGELGMAKMAALAREPSATADLEALMDAMLAGAAMRDLAAFAYAIWAEIRREIDPADWDATPVLVYLEVHGETADADLFRAHLFNETSGAIVIGSELNSASVTKARIRSAAFSFDAGANVYYVEFASSDGGVDHVMYDAVLIVDVG